MKHIHFDIEPDGFYGAYWACKQPVDCAMIAMIGDDPEDDMARSCGGFPSLRRWRCWRLVL